MREGPLSCHPIALGQSDGPQTPNAIHKLGAEQCLVVSGMDMEHSFEDNSGGKCGKRTKGVTFDVKERLILVWQ